MITLTTSQPARHSAPTVKAIGLAYLIWARPDLERAAAFLADFGLIEMHRTEQAIYFRGTAAAPFCYELRKADKPAFVGFALEVASRDDLLALAALPGSSVVQALNKPGGGECVQLRDPSGFLVEAVHGRQAQAALPHRSALALNTVDQMPRVNDTQRAPVGVPEVIKLGHVVLELADFQATCGWYTQHFGLIPSDVQVLPDGSPAVVFLRLDLGDTPADHHTLAFAQGFAAQYSHSAFELVDQDAVGMGQRILRERGYRHAWGMGRHVLGSQIFDYWQDPWNAKHEHYCDGDVFTANVPMGVHPVSAEAMSQWGQPMPASFTRPKFSLGNIALMLRNLRRSPDVSLKKLITLARLFT
ncbi:MAG: VOC family protein [Alcanivoracaceae bacterium]|nr:VOC family protein [Alcanivoracaceae bacterium]